MAKLDPYMISKWEQIRRILIPRGKKGRDERTTIEIVLSEIEQLTGAAIEPDWTLAECGLASVADPVVINRLQSAVPGVTISLQDLVEVDTTTQLANLLAERLQEANASGVGTVATTTDQGVKLSQKRASFVGLRRRITHLYRHM
eukprot:7389742-Prymnesium_polylepis.1